MFTCGLKPSAYRRYFDIAGLSIFGGCAAARWGKDIQTHAHRMESA
jgi:hypothetical protein